MHCPTSPRAYRVPEMPHRSKWIGGGLPSPRFGGRGFHARFDNGMYWHPGGSTGLDVDTNASTCTGTGSVGRGSSCTPASPSDSAERRQMSSAVPNCLMLFRSAVALAQLIAPFVAIERAQPRARRNRRSATRPSPGRDQQSERSIRLWKRDRHAQSHRAPRQSACCIAIEQRLRRNFPRPIVRQMTFQPIALPYGGPPRRLPPMARAGCGVTTHEGWPWPASIVGWPHLEPRCKVIAATANRR